ncbi:MAG: CotH kinase family protein [Pricia sp.]
MRRRPGKLRKLVQAVLLIAILQFTVSCNEDDTPQFSTPGEEVAGPERPDIPLDSRLPLFTINTGSNTIVDEPKVDAMMTITEGDTESYKGAIGIEFRGATSQSFPKKSFGLETRDENNEDLDVSLLGFPEEEDWILYGPYSDKSLIRNVLIYDLARKMEHYASRTRFVELTINDSYQGIYVFMEKLKRDDGRIDISNLKEDETAGEDLTGGYILKIDKTAGTNLGEGYNDQNSFGSAYKPLNAASGQEINFLYEEPDAEDIVAEQKSYISNYVGQFEDALASDDFADPELGYAAYIDTQSFIDFFLLNELSNNVDGYRLSTFMYKDKNEKLKMGPIWDFNLAFGNVDYCSGGETDVWAYRFNERCPEDFWLVPFWWDRLLQDPSFAQQLKERWTTLRGNVFSESAVLSQIDGYIATLENAGAVQPNFDQWSVLGTYIWPNNFIGKTYMEETDYLKGWVSDRIAWLDGAIEGL